MPQYDPDTDSFAGSLAADPEAHEALQDILAVLRARTGHDFRHYKQPTVLRRIDRRMQVRRVRDLHSYRRLLDEEIDEAPRLLEELLIGVTSFFRDGDEFAALEDAVVPRLFEGKGPDDEVRAWVTACSTGEEACSLAMLLAEHASHMRTPPKIQLFATDLDARAIQAARAGVYPAAIAADVPADLLGRYFTLEHERYTLQPSLRQILLFAEHNLLSDPPFSRLDLVSCRNFLIYLDRDHHRQMLELFHFALRPGGYLFLGSAETAEAANDLFEPVDARRRLYRARPSLREARPGRGAAVPDPAPRLAMGSTPAAPPRTHAYAYTQSYAELHRRGAVRAAPPSILVDRDGQVLHIGEDAGRYLKHAGGEPTRDLVALVAPELRLELRTALFQARLGGKLSATARIPQGAPEAPQALSVTVQPLREPDARADGLLLVQFHEMDAAHQAAHPGQHDTTLLRRLDEALRDTRRKLHETMDQADVAEAESRVANEWLQSTLAQLRAALEEQRAAQEELQSVNEELMTVNAQLRLKVDETGKAHDDLSNLIASTDIATIFLDREMRIQRTTPRVREVFNVIPSDVGRPLTHLAGRLDYPELARDIGGVLASLRPLEREVHGQDGHFYIVRIHPYRTTDDLIDGAVMTLFDITHRRAAEQALRRSEERHRAELEQLVAERTGELQTSRDLLRATMDSSTDMIQVFEPGRLPERVVGVAFNITARKRAEETVRSSERRHAFLLELSDALRPLDDAGEIVLTAARVLGERLGADRAWYMDIDEAHQSYTVACDWRRPGQASHAGRYPMDAWVMPWLDDGRTWIMADVDTDPQLPDAQRPRYRGKGIRAAVVVPLIKGARPVAAFSASQSTPRAWTATEVALIEDTAERVRAAVERSKAGRSRP